MNRMTFDLGRMYYQESEPLIALQARDKRQLTRKYVIEVKKKAVCAGCKIDFPHWILQFDHVRGEKIGDVNVLARTGDMERLQEEIAKCDVVCANCHAHRTWMRSVQAGIDARGLST